MGRAICPRPLHDAFAGIWRKADAFDPLATQPVAWMMTIVRKTERGVTTTETLPVRFVPMIGKERP